MSWELALLGIIAGAAGFLMLAVGVKSHKDGENIECLISISVWLVLTALGYMTLWGLITLMLLIGEAFA